MASTFTTGKAHLEKPANNDDINTWNVPLNADFDVIDNCVSATTTLTFSNADITLTQPQMQAMRIGCIGTLLANVNLKFQSGVPGFFMVQNLTSGNFTVTAATPSVGNTVVVPQLKSVLVFTDGTNVYISDDGVAQQVAALFVPPGAIMDFAMSVAPAGWLVCDGSAVSRTTYAALFANISTTWGVGNGSTTFNLPPLLGQFRRGWDSSGAIDPARAFASAQTDALKSHGHGINDPTHTHLVGVVGAAQFGTTATGPVNTTVGATVTTSASATGVTVQNSTAPTPDETRPKNYAVLTCIKT